MEALYAGIRISDISSSFTINATASTILAMYVAMAEKQSIDISNLAGTLQNDILKEYTSRGTYIFPPKPSMRLVTDMIEYCCRNMPRFYPVNIQGVFFRGYGATKAQEMGYTIADAVEYIDWTLERGV